MIIFHKSKTPNDNKRLLFILSFCILTTLNFAQTFNSKTQASTYEFLKSSSDQCFYTKQLKKCNSAIQRAEELQYIAGSNENYYCQTKLLGFQAKLIMVMLNMPRGISYLRNLNDIKRNCGYLF